MHCFFCEVIVVSFKFEHFFAIVMFGCRFQSSCQSESRGQRLNVRRLVRKQTKEKLQESTAKKLIADPERYEALKQGCRSEALSDLGASRRGSRGSQFATGSARSARDRCAGCPARPAAAAVFTSAVLSPLGPICFAMYTVFNRRNAVAAVAVFRSLPQRFQSSLFN